MLMQCRTHVGRPSAVKRSSLTSQKSVFQSTVLVAAHSTRQQVGLAESSSNSSSTLLPLALAGALFSSTPLAAWADEASAAAPIEVAEDVQQAAAAAADAAAEAAPAPTWLSYVVVLAPIIFYAIFNAYRSQVNPRIKFSDFLFIVAGIAVVANLVSIIAFKVRLF